jgi:hypothetical protein
VDVKLQIFPSRLPVLRERRGASEAFDQTSVAESIAVPGWSVKHIPEPDGRGPFRRLSVDRRVTAKNRWLIIPALAILTAAVYGAAIDDRPFDRQEALLESQSQSLLASGGRDANGRLLPLFVHAGGDEWLAPGQAYMAATAELLSPSRLSPIRWITVLAGVLDVALMFVLATRVFSSAALGTVAALLLLFTPAHAQFSRSAGPEGVWPLPFLFAWLLGLVVFSDLSSPFRRHALAIGPSRPQRSPTHNRLQRSWSRVRCAGSAVAWYKRKGGQWQWPDVRPACVAFVMTRHRLPSGSRSINPRIQTRSAGGSFISPTSGIRWTGFEPRRTGSRLRASPRRIGIISVRPTCSSTATRWGLPECS